MKILTKSGDIVYVTLFPQLLLVVHYENGINARGSQVGFAVAIILRVLGGEASLGLPPMIKFPGYDCVAKVQNFPFKTFTMICSMIGCVIGSRIFTDPNPMSEEDENYPFYKAKTPYFIVRAHFCTTNLGRW